MFNIVIFGAPGSGKGTQSERIAKKYGLHHISTGEVLRQEIADKSELGLIAQEYISNGYLVPDDLVINMLADMINKHPDIKGFLFDGFPRTITQGEALDSLLREKNTSIAMVLNLSVDEKESISRMLKRGEQSGRSDDNLETIKKRIEVYKEQTEPLTDYYKKQGKLFRITGSGTSEDVLEKIMEEIDRMNP